MQSTTQELTCKTVLITGGASGIGFGIATYLANKGHYIIIADMNQDAAKHAADILVKAGNKAEALSLNVTDTAAIEDLPEQLSRPVDVLINNAGIQHVSKLEEFPADKFRLLIDVMLTGPALLTKAFLPAMRERNYGRIINVGSIHSLIASPYKSAYVAAKHGLVGFAKTVALETGNNNITINNLCPAYVKTPLVEKQIGAQAKENNMTEQEVIEKIFLEPMPKKAFIDIEELAATAEFLMQDAAKNMTAQNLVLDGGWIAR
ncbi:MAG: 3-hydroxybutyrate dehydrogenase [Glaciecola sp.]